MAGLGYLDKSESLISGDMQETMKRLVRIEKLVEEILTIRAQMVEYDRKRNHNRECLGAFRRGEVKQQSSKLWLSYADQMIKMPRKNIMSIVEGD